MPSVSAKQAKFFSAVSHGWQPPGRHVDVKVAEDFHKADVKAGKFEHQRRQSSDHNNGYAKHG